MSDQIIGDAGQSFFDVWTIVHVAFWLVVGASAQVVRKRKKLPHFQLALYSGAVAVWFLAMGWEFIERFYFETHGYVAHPEVWFNRWLSDPLVGVAAWMLGMMMIDHE